MTQSLASAQLRFDVASIRPTTDRHDESLIVNPGGLIYSRVSLKDCLESAYSVKRYQISGPDWLETQLFDITARVEGNHSKDEIMLMLQTLLADRFNLALHREQKELPVYALLVGKNGSKLHKSDGDGDFSMGPTSGGIGFQRISMADCGKVSIATASHWPTSSGQDRSRGSLRLYVGARHYTGWRR